MTTGQLTTVLWLRWRLTRNQWRRQGILAQILGSLALVILVGLVPGAAVGGFALGYAALAHAAPNEVLLAWDVMVGVFLFGWVLGLLSELQRSEVFDLTRLLHLPVSARGLFLLNFAVSHLTPSVLVAVPALGGIVAGFAMANGAPQLLLLPLGLGTLLMITSWTYCLRGWLAAMMVNPRRRRTVVLGITAAFVVAAQVPSLLVLTKKDRHGDPAAPGVVRGTASGPLGLRFPPTAWMVAHGVVPFLWLPLGAQALAQTNPWPALVGTAATTLIGALGIRRAHRATLRFYQGTATSTPDRARAVPAAGRKTGRSRTWRIPGARDTVRCVAEVTARTLLRAPEVRLALLSTLAMSGAFLFMLLMNRRATTTPQVTGLMVLGAGFLAQFTLGQLFCNQFGLDRDGFRSFLLSPLARSDILLGKNLALGGVAVAAGLTSLALLRCLVPIPLFQLAAGLVQCVIIAVLMGLAGNLVSILMPYRMATGTLKKASTPLGVTLGIMVVHLAMPIVVLPAALPTLVGFLWHQGGRSGLWPVELGVAVAVLTGCLALYRLCLPAMGDLLQSRQLKILEALTRAAE